tara:strand:- start:1673 stop:2443 length:771 start_codon:yes stop_codon:yes gene_type:complete
MNNNTYEKAYKSYLDNLKSHGHSLDEFIEFKFESIYSSSLDSYNKFISWYEKAVKKCSMKSELISFDECKNWSFSKDKKKFFHSSGEFYEISCYRVSGTKTREVESGWDQPLLRQVGDDGGILGVIRQKIDGLPHYLVEAKQEAGNYNIVQISTTVQATFSNIKRAHEGKSVRFSEYFLFPKKNNATVIFSQWMSEDGGRLFNKRNKVMLVEVDKAHNLSFDQNLYRWVTLYDIKRAIKEENAIIAPHLRNLLSAL